MGTTHALDAFLAWAKEGDIYFDPLDIRIDETGSRSAFARRAIARSSRRCRSPT